MDNIRDSIEILFSKSNPEKIIQAFFRELKSFDLSEHLSKEPFLALSEMLENNKTKDELEAVYKIVDGKWSHYSMDASRRNPPRQNVFFVLYHFANDVLFEREEKPVCEFEHLLRWRDLSYKLGEDIFTTAFFAYEDLSSKRERHYFSWLPTIPTNNCHLQEVIERGVTDIHFHLKGSSLNFDLSWLSLMNHITGRKKEFAEIKNSKMPDANPWFGEPQLSLYALCIKAFAIRQMIFRILIKDNSIKDKPVEDHTINNLYLPVLRSDNEEELLFYTYELQKEADILAHLHGKKYRDDYVDYAIKKTFSDKNYDPDSYHNSALYGERWLMYKMFHLIFSGEKERTSYKCFFYAYLIIKIRLRKELIQVNPYPGFRNFQEYQDRKELFLDGKPVYKELLVNIAINNALHGLHVKYLEARIVPGNSLKANMSFIERLDKMVYSPKKFKLPIPKDMLPKKQSPFSLIYKNSSATYLDSCIRDYYHAQHFIYDENTDEKYPDIIDRYYYIFHFIKQKDKSKWLADETKLIRPRHSELRKSIKEQTMAINLMRRQVSPVKERLAGIDAASSEIGCRPEVFAQAYRYLKNYSTELDNHFLANSSLLPLGYTYHAGEDFLDISDGLRAIDEVVKFLNFNRGDRLGHGLALGIDPDEYYEKKNYHIVLPKQDILDNVVWVRMQIQRYNIPTSQSLVLELQKHYSSLVHEIYEGEVIRYKGKEKDRYIKENDRYKEIEVHYKGKKKDRYIKEQGIYKEIEVCTIPMELYYQSWLLRGDAPSLYFEDSVYDQCRFNPLTYWEKCGRNDFDECNKARENSIARCLYKAYHFSTKAKREGGRYDEFKISKDYIELIRKIQHAMMHSLARQYISIETNPTSNKLIGDYKQYADLPLKRFFNLGLTHDSAEIASSPQLSVSLNTDDLGVFSTSIENEYALMAIAMEKEVDANGQPRYTSRMIYDWLDRIRSMGFEQRFKKDKSFR